ncbi:hypothetical protein V2J09_001001 [Rumex salicifolius]
MAMADKEKRDTPSSKDGEAWGTLEELLLACAISRHGTESWDFIALEVQKRATSRISACKKNSLSNNFSNSFTPHDCEQRYRALNCRFDVTGGENDIPAVKDDGGKSDGENYVVGEPDLREKLPFMIDELRRLRVEELRREVERHDGSIMSLQSKVKRLEEERERNSLKAEEQADLRTGTDRSDAGANNRGRKQHRSTETDKPISREPSTDESEDRSLNESNSTSHNASQRIESNRKRKPNINENGEPVPVRPALDAKPDKKNSKNVVGRPSQPVRLGNPSELRASVSQTNREAKEIEAPEDAMQGSDVQSSASLSVRKRRGWRRSNGVGSGSNEIEEEKLSPANKRVNVKSQPLIMFLEIVRSHKHGLVFQRRLPSQKTHKYKNLIRQHMDMETVESKLERGLYFDSHPTFYRDLLLIFTNAVLFFRKGSTEHLAARELRKLVTKEIAGRKPYPGSDPQAPEPDTNTKKPPSSSVIVVCRRRRNNIASAKIEEQEAVEGGGLKAEPSTGKDMPMKLKRERSNLRTSSNSAADESHKRRKEGAVNFVKRMNRDSPEELQKKVVVEAPKTRVSGRRSVSTTPKRNPKR